MAVNSLVGEQSRKDNSIQKSAKFFDHSKTSNRINSKYSSDSKMTASNVILKTYNVYSVVASMPRTTTPLPFDESQNYNYPRHFSSNSFVWAGADTNLVTKTNSHNDYNKINSSELDAIAQGFAISDKNEGALLGKNIIVPNNSALIPLVWFSYVGAAKNCVNSECAIKYDAISTNLLVGDKTLTLNFDKSATSGSGHSSI